MSVSGTKRASSLLTKQKNPETCLKSPPEKKLKVENNNCTLDESRPPSKGNRLEPCPSFYYSVGDLQYIAPYTFNYKCFAKGRWFNRRIYEVLCSEFIAFDAEYYAKAIENGQILVRNQRISCDYILRNGDWFSHRIHRHEPPVLMNEKMDIEIIAESESFIVVNKPSSIPMHPSGAYRYNSLVSILFQKLNKIYHCCHRLDRQTSGLCILSKNTRFASKIGEKIRNRTMKKTYLARVRGRFPSDIQLIRVNRAIRTKDHQRGIHEICEEIKNNGKEAITDFKFISYDLESNSSLVECFPITGRTHQIRLHLQYLGFPIANDTYYGGRAESMNTENDVNHKFNCAANECLITDEKRNILLKVLNENFDENCAKCQERRERLQLKGKRNSEVKEKKPYLVCIWLHALRYECNEWSFETPLPLWAKLK